MFVISPPQFRSALLPFQCQIWHPPEGQCGRSYRAFYALESPSRPFHSESPHTAGPAICSSSRGNEWKPPKEEDKAIHWDIKQLCQFASFWALIRWKSIIISFVNLVSRRSCIPVMDWHSHFFSTALIICLLRIEESHHQHIKEINENSYILMIFLRWSRVITFFLWNLLQLHPLPLHPRPWQIGGGS